MAFCLTVLTLFVILICQVTAMVQRKLQCEFEEIHGTVTGRCRGNILNEQMLSLHDKHRITHLKLSNNNFKEMDENTFRDMSNLKSLELDHNELHSVGERTLWNLTKLEYLDLSFNNFSYSSFKEDFFKFQWESLKCLKLTTNRSQTHYPHDLLKRLINLEELHINGINMQTFPKEIAHLPSLSILNLQVPCFEEANRTITLEYMTHLKTSNIKELSLQSNGIQFLPKGCFTDFKSLKTLNLANNMNLQFKHVTDTLSHLGSTSLETLILDGISFGHVTIWDSNDFCNDLGKNLVRFSSKYCGIVGGKLTVFNCFRKLRTLSFGYNYPLQWKRENQSYSDNDFQFFPKTLKVLDMSHMLEFKNRLFYDIYSTKDKILSSDYFFEKPLGKLLQYTSVNQSTYKTFRSSHFQIPEGPKTYDQIPPNAEALNIDYMNLEGELAPVVLNEDNNLKAFSGVGNEKSKTLKAYFPWYNMEKLIFFDASKTNIYLSNDLLTPTGVLFPNLRVLNISWNNLEHQTNLLPRLFRTMPYLESLDLSHSGIESLPKESFGVLSNLEILNLAGNRLSHSLDIDIGHLTNLQILNLSDNSLDRLSKSLTDTLDDLSEQSSLTIDFQGNPLRCECSTLDFLIWVHMTPINIWQRENLDCIYENSTHSISTVDLGKLGQTCSHPVVKYVHVLIIMGVMSALTILFGILIYRKRWFLQWHYYKLRRSFTFGTKSQPDCDALDHKPFDALVVYCEESDNDRHVVAQILREKLEKERQFNIFFNGRNDTGGNLKAEETIRGIELSEKSILLVTPDFIKDEWCIFALHMVIESGDIANRLCILLQDDVDFQKMPKILLKLAGPYSGVCVIEHDKQVWYEGGSAKQKLLLEGIANFLAPKSQPRCL